MPTATDADALRYALETADEGDRITIPPNTVIDVGNTPLPTPPNDIELVSGSGAADRPAAIVRCRDSLGRNALLKTGGEITIRGLAFVGPETNHIQYDNQREKTALHAHGSRAVIGGCAFVGWPFAGAAFGTRGTATKSLVENTSFRHCLMEGLGYGIQLYNGLMTVRGCDFNWTRHAISSFGYPTCSYTAAECRVGAYTLSHAFDQHQVTENLSTEQIENRGIPARCAGGDTFIHGCQFAFTHDIEGRAQEAIAIRGVPAGTVVITDNDFAHPHPPAGSGGPGDAFRQQTAGWERLVHFGNRYGVTRRGGYA